MVLSSILAIVWSVGGFVNSNLPYGFDSQMDINGYTGFVTSSVFCENDVVYYFDCVSRFDLSFLTNDVNELPSSTYDLAVYFRSVTTTILFHSNLSDYSESYTATFTINTFYGYGEFETIAESVLYTEFHDDNVGFDLKYDIGGNTFVWSKDNITGYYSTYSAKRGEFPAMQFLNAVKSGFSVFSNESYNTGFADGRAVGIQEGRQEDATIASIFSGILEVGLVPINFFLAIFNFEILGINITSFVTALLTVCLVIIMLRTMFGGGSEQ